MHVVIWRFRIRDSAAAEFERHYRPDGTWATLFRRDPAYLGTELLRGPDSCVTIDRWTTAEAYDAFRAAFADEYARIDAECEELTVGEEKVGEFSG